MVVSPNVTFYGCCRDAVEFYSRVFSVESKTVLLFRDVHGHFSNWINPQNEDLVYSAALRFRGGTTVTFRDSIAMIYQDNGSGGKNKDNVTFDVSDLTLEEIQHIYAAFMGDGAMSNIALGPRPDHQLYASLIDRFGICWNLTGSGD